MSALGEYVHMLTNNYLKYGVSRNSQGSSASSRATNLEAYRKMRLGEIPPINKSNVNVLKQVLINNTSKSENQDITVLDRNFQRRIDLVYEALGRMTSVENINSYNYSGGANAWQASQRFTVGGTEGTTQGFGIPQIRELKTLREDIENLLNIASKGVMTQAQFDELQQKYNVMSNKVSLSASMEGASLSNIKSMAGQLQEAINIYNFTDTYNHVIGDWGELFVASLALTAQDLAEENADAAIMKILSGVKGSQRSNAYLKKSDIAIDASQFNQINRQSNGNGFWLKKSQDKVDVQISFNGELVNATVKNYKESTYNKEGGLKLQNVPLLYALVYINRQGDLANHWLNRQVIPAQWTGRTSIGNFNYINRLLKFELAYEALASGNPLKKGVDKANIFVWLNREHPEKTVVLSTAEMLSGAGLDKYFIFTREDLLADGIANRDPGFAAANKPVEGEPHNAAMSRIANVLHHLNSISIGVRYKDLTL